MSFDDDRTLRRGTRWAACVWFAMIAAFSFLVLACDALESPRVPSADAGAAPQRLMPDLPEEAVEDDKAAAQHLLIQFEGAVRAPPTLIRTRDQARQLAEELAGKAAAPGADFDALVRQSSEEPGAASTAGRVGVFRRGEMVAPFEEAVFALAVGGISDVVESPFGFHVIKRVPIEEVRASHILVQYVGAQNARSTVTRTREQAQQIATDVRRQALEPGNDFVDLARQYSDCPSAEAGGDLGLFGRGVMVPTFEDAAFGLPIDGTSEIIETPFGFHVIRRTG